jgi:hypothetical protein
MTVLVSDFTINEVLTDKLNQIKEGKEFLDNFNKFILIYGGARAYTELMGLAKELRTSAIDLNDNEVTDITTQVSAKAVKSTGVLDNAFLAGWDEVKVLAMKPRPPISTYINPAFEAQHLAKFQGEASCLTFESSITSYNQIGRNDGLVILSDSDMDKVLLESGGNVALIEKALGIPNYSWQNRLNNPLIPDKLVRIKIKNPENFDLRMATGNEAGANEFWIPGGYTPEKYIEAVISPIPATQINSYTKTTIAETR